jgi:asparagine synthase (glutamine-hydrolysing)
MCGIGGYVDPRGALNGPQVLIRLAAALVHRGPDGEGFFSDGPFGLAHRRLAIIDLSEGGAQPMRVGPITVVLNGEIYNYRELREELRREGQAFVSASDTEVLARAYLEWGERCLPRLRGMWAFAIHDARARTLVCSRDPFGIKPFYYASHQGAFLFASEPQALISAGVPARANLAAAAQYLALGLSDYDDHCFFQGITQLRAGETIMVSADASVRCIDRWDARASGDGPPASLTEFATTLAESVRLHLRSDVPIGTCLSGGLDSSTVAALAANVVRDEGGPRFTAITAASDDPRTDERQYARQVVAHCDLDWHVVIPGADQFAREIDECIRAQGEPMGGPSGYFQYCVMRAARAAGLKVMLDGQGADEILAGYERYVAPWALGISQRAGMFTALGEFARLANRARPGLRGMAALALYVLSPRLRRRVIARRTTFLRREFSACVLEVVTRISSASRRLHDARVADITAFSLPALLRFEDRNSMAHSIEARVPYVDRQVVSCALRLPDAGLLENGFTKYPLRVLAAGILPDAIAWRRSKIGFEPPTASWLAALAGRMQQRVEHSSLIARLCGRVPRLHDFPLALQWRLYNLARWQQLLDVNVD